ncbi:type IV secretion system DNA-binding domain-containing protein [Patescibacteria group bacterium]|nr:type IV secretion system DNA-binding domain-containing protein [Patescibacteria group bacterium]MCL5114402.1 type IV secretion system DNA-binding domain-containing protein [Patescibacteria group bacterium]
MAENDKDVAYFGRVDFRNSNKLFGIKRRDRRQHMYVIGKTGTGKTAMLNNLIVQDIANGEGLCVVDPHGELVEGLLEKIPEERLQDVIYFNPADTDFHIGFNVLELPDPKYKHLVASGLMGIFTKIWSNVWSARMEYILNNAILALLDTPGTTLLGITRILVDKEYRQKIVDNIKDPVVKAFWVNEFEEWRDQFRNEAIAPIQNKVGQFLSTALVRNIVGQSKSTVDIFDIMNTGKIFLVNVSKGRIGEDNSALLGSMLITKMQLAAMERVRIPEDERVDFYLYVDEFQNFATDSFANILSEARKYRLDLILAHQYVGQLVTDVSTKVRDAVFGNVGTMVSFRVGAADAEFLEKEFEPEFMAQDLVNLPNYHVYLKLLVDGVTSRPFSATTLPPFNLESSPAIAEKIIETSRRIYARPRWAVEEEINRWSGVMAPKEEGMTERRFEHRHEEKETASRFSDLAKLGIEFQENQGGGASGMHPAGRTSAPSHASHNGHYERRRPFLNNFRRQSPVQKPVNTRKQTIVGGDEAPETPPDTGTISLADLKEETKSAKGPKEGNHDIESLRESLKESLKNLGS